MRECEWIRASAWLEVQIKVGNAWVTYEKIPSDDMGEAERKAAKALADPSVSSARILEHSMRHVCDQVRVMESHPEFKVPPKMTDTGRRGVCRACGSETMLASDGIAKWAFCVADDCKKALPA